jgi:hypothetical protein
MAVIQFDTAAFNARAAEFRAAAQQNGGGHTVQKMADPGGADIAAINGTWARMRDKAQEFVNTMRSMQVQNPTAALDQMHADLQAVVSALKNRPTVATSAQSNLLSRSRVSNIL